jgi:hypothetical protein
MGAGFGGTGGGSVQAEIRAAAAAAKAEGAGARADIKSHYAARIDAARRSGLPKEQIAAMVLAIRQEMQAAMTAAAARAGAQLTDRMGAVSGSRGRRRDPNKGGKPPGTTKPRR